MKKTVSVIFEFATLIGTVLGIIGLLSQANEYMYHQPPPAGFILTDSEFLALAKSGKDQPLVKHLLAADQEHMFEKDGSAVRELTQAIQENPEYTQSYYYRGLIYLSVGYIKEGITDLQIVLEKSDDPELHQQADREIILARIAQTLTPFPFLGLAAFAALFIAVQFGVKLTKWRRAATIFVVVVCVIWALSFMFLLLH